MEKKISKKLTCYNNLLNQENIIDQQEIFVIMLTNNIEEITRILDQELQAKNIRSQVRMIDNCLEIILESSLTLDQNLLIPIIEKTINDLKLDSLKIVKISGKNLSSNNLEWERELALDQNQPFFTNIWGNITKITADLGNQTTQAGQSLIENLTSTVETTQKIAVSTTEMISQTTDNTIKTVTNTVINTSETVNNTINSTTKSLNEQVAQIPQNINNIIDLISKNPVLQGITKGCQIDWLLNIIVEIDVVKATTYVNNLKQKYPEEKSRDLAYRIILEKSAYVATTGLATSLIPGMSTALLTVDLAATTAIQAEMIYQIAAAYDLDLEDPSRKVEVLTVFSLALGGNYAIKSGLGLLRNIPLAGAVIGASSNAVMLYALGYAACNFYEAQINPENINIKLQETQTKSEAFLQNAIHQEVIMDQILAHVYLVGNPEKSWQEMLPELDHFSFSPASLEVIKELEELPPLELLLEQINQDFAVAILAKSEKIALLDGVITEKEYKTLNLIKNKLNNQVNLSKTNLPQTLFSLSLLGSLIAILSGQKPLIDQEINQILAQVDQMSGEDFEQFLSLCFQRLGYRVQTTPKTNDYGADLILIKDQKKTIVQAKRYQAKVGNSAVQEVVAALKYYQAETAIVITNSQFTENAEKLAIANHVQLWDRQKLIDLINKSRH